MTDIPQLSSKSNEHYTPSCFVESARNVMEYIYLDPASCPEANRTVGADLIYTADDDGLTKRWLDTVFLNPPGGCVRWNKDQQRWLPAKTGQSSAAVWWGYLLRQYYSGSVREAVFIGFTLEIIRSTQNKEVCQRSIIHANARCYPRSRICFGGKDQPTHGNVIAYLGPRKNRFIEEFSRYGECE